MGSPFYAQVSDRESIVGPVRDLERATLETSLFQLIGVETAVLWNVHSEQIVHGMKPTSYELFYDNLIFYYPECILYLRENNRQL